VSLKTVKEGVLCRSVQGLLGELGHTPPQEGVEQDGTLLRAREQAPVPSNTRSRYLTRTIASRATDNVS
jgi:hypothetical protein